MQSNQTQPSETFDSLRVAAERLLSAALNNSIEIERVECLTEAGRRNLLLRCFIQPVEGIPASFIIKKVEGDNYDPDRANASDTKRLFNDWVGSQFLNAIPSQVKHSPRFYGGDRLLGAIVIEDVQHRNSLVEPLLGSDRDRAEWALLEYATCLGHLHGDTIGKVEEFKRLYRTLSPNKKFPQVRIDIAKYQSMLKNLGIEIDRGCLQDLEAINKTVSNPHEFLCYIHTDACPDNVLDTGTQLRLIDFETGCFGHALLDMVFGRMMFPSCWCSNRIPDTMVKQMEHTYREILIKHCRVAEDDNVFNAALVDACGIWLSETLLSVKFVLDKDRDFGISTIRQRILARLSAFIATSQEFNRLPNLRSTSNKLLDLLGKQWSDIAPLPLYPAFLEQ